MDDVERWLPLLSKRITVPNDVSLGISCIPPAKNLKQWLKQKINSNSKQKNSSQPDLLLQFLCLHWSGYYAGSFGP